mmetsp:Transcript_25357/g.50518  ORF Transcript_25357/g.50518 Transcript_25357/m.50518 type:complete len:442 (-) Transcript_25357:1526-2851(-)
MDCKALFPKHLPLGFGPVRHNGANYDDQCRHPTLNYFPVHRHLRDLTPLPILVPGASHFVPSHLQSLPELHGRKRRGCSPDQPRRFVEQGPVHEILRFPRPEIPQGSHGLGNPGSLVGQCNDRGVGRLSAKVGIIEAVSRVGAGEACRVGAVRLHALLEGEEVPHRLGHFRSVHEDVAVGVVSPGPELGCVGPDGGVVEEGHSQVIGDEILRRAAEMEGVPVLEFRPHLLQGCGVNARVRRHGPLLKDVVEDCVGHILRLDAVRPHLAVEVALPLQNMRNGVVRHVDGGVGQTLNDPFVVPREQGSKAELTGARPLLEPPDGILVFRQRRGVVRLESAALLRDVFGHGPRPQLVRTICQVPLVGGGDDALVPRPAHDPALGFVVNTGLSRRNHLVANDGFRLRHLHTRVRSGSHDARREALEVGLVLCLFELRFIVEGGNL